MRIILTNRFEFLQYFSNSQITSAPKSQKLRTFIQVGLQFTVLVINCVSIVWVQLVMQFIKIGEYIPIAITTAGTARGDEVYVYIYTYIHK